MQPNPREVLPAESPPRSTHSPRGTTTAGGQPPAVCAPGSRPALDAVSQPVDELLTRFLDDRVADLVALDPDLEPVGQAIAALVRAGGKRLRPAFVYWGHRATGAGHDDEVLVAAAAVELLHTFALVHDDVMDRSETRRGLPAVHEALAAAHARAGLLGDPGWFGVGGAILAGDLAFVWADQLLDSARLPGPALERARLVFSHLRTEVMAGQYLDLRMAGDALAGEDQARRVALLKSGRYTVTRPLQMGAALGEPDAVLDAALRAFGDAVGLAFQLRDDVLGLFGDPAETGKSALSDLREGKRTVLVLTALARAGAAGRAHLERVLGNPAIDEDDLVQARRVVDASGALEVVEGLLAAERVRAERALRPISGPARDALAELAELAVFRAR